MKDFDLIREHAALTCQASDAMAEAGAARLLEEMSFFHEMGHPLDLKFLAAACYEAMVHSTIKRGLYTAGVNVEVEDA